MRKTIVLDNKSAVIKLPGAKYISSHEEYCRFFPCTKRLKAVFILAELFWEGCDTSSFYGIELARELRQRYRIQCRIIICSYWPRERFISKSNPYAAGNILNSPLMDFIRLSDTNPADFKIAGNSLDDCTLDDLLYSFYDIRGIAGEQMHDLDNWLSANYEKEQAEKVIHITNTLSNVKQLIHPERVNDYNMLCNILIEQLNTSSDIDLSILIRNNTDKIYELLNDESAKIDDDVSLLYNINWSVILVDDNPHQLQLIQEALSLIGILSYTFSTPEESLHHIKGSLSKKLKYPGQSIGSKHKDKIPSLVLITDLRFVDKNGKWNDIQGVDFCRKISENSVPPITPIILTNKRGSLLRQIQNLPDYNFRIFYKKDVFKEQNSLHSFVKQIVSIGNSAFFESQSRPQPTLRTWIEGSTKISYPLAAFYRTHCLSVDYAESEARINDSASSFLKNFEQSRESVNLMPVVTISGPPTQRRYLEIFRNRILLTRRIIWGLFAVIKMDNPDDDIEKAIFTAISSIDKDSLDDKIDSEKKLNSQMDQVFLTTMAISFKGKNDLVEKLFAGSLSTHSDILLEEIRFLNSHFGSESFICKQDNDVLDSFLLEIRKFSSGLRDFHLIFDIDRVYS